MPGRSTQGSMALSFRNLAGPNLHTEDDQLTIRGQHQQFALAIGLVGRAMHIARRQGVQVGLDRGVKVRVIGAAQRGQVLEAAAGGLDRKTGVGAADIGDQLRRLHRVASWSERVKPEPYAMMPLAEAAE